MNKVFQTLNLVMVVIFFIQMVVLFCGIDLLPFLAIGLICGLVIILRNSSEDFFYSSGESGDTGTILKFIGLACLNIFVFSMFILLGVENIANMAINLLDSSKLFRFTLYGLIFPMVISYFIAWFWYDEKPNLSLFYALTAPNTLGLYYKLFLILSGIGLFICVNWVDYSDIVSSLLRFF